MTIVPAVLFAQFVKGTQSRGLFDYWLGYLSPKHSVRNDIIDNPWLTLVVRDNETTSPPGSVFVGEPEETTRKPTQEIDETVPIQNCKYVTWNSSHNHKNTKIPLKANLADEKKGIKHLLSIIQEHKPILITSTVVEVATEYTTVFPSCLKFEHASRMCEGSLITIEPTSTASNGLLQRTASIQYEVNEAENESVNPHEYDNLTSSNNAELLIPLKTMNTMRHNDSSEPVSDYDYEFETFQRFFDNTGTEEEKNTYEATPGLEGDQRLPKELNSFSNVMKQKYVIRTEVISIPTTVTTTDTAITATVIIRDCIPRDIRIPLCEPESSSFMHHRIPSFPIFFNHN